LGKKLVESAEQEGIFETYQSLQADVATFWADAEEKYVKPILDALDPELRKSVVAIIHSSEEETEGSKKAIKKETKDTAKPEAAESNSSGCLKTEIISNDEVKTTVPGDSIKVQEVQGERKDSEQKKRKISEDEDDLVDERPTSKQQRSAAASQPESEVTEIPPAETNAEEASEKAVASKSILTPLEQAVKDVKAAYILAKKAYRISITRRERVQEALTCYLGTCNFHNYTIQKTYSDPSAKRVIRSFEVGPHPIIINDTEWLSLKVHGQSFMMHQIRKMVAMAALVVRCGAKTDIIKESYGPANISIPKAPGLGLLLERPVFDNYNERAVKEFNRETIDFKKYEKEMDEFKQREIYDRIFREEERDHQFHAFFHHIDHYKTDYFLWVTAGGIAAAKQSKAPARTDDASDDEADVNGEEG
jgi:tRNA pseudouridine38-40 synthase